MKFRKLLLGSATAMLVSGAAQAADLFVPVAEPINYVRVCDAFGNTYWYSPGTETCLSITGFARVELRFAPGETASAITNPPNGPTNTVAAAWSIRSSMQLAIAAKRQTDWGRLGADITIVSTSDNNAMTASNAAGGNNILQRLVTLDTVRVSLGNFSGGWFTNLYNREGIHKTITVGNSLAGGSSDQFQYAVTVGDLSFAVAAADPRDRANVGNLGAGAANPASMTMPDLMGRVGFKVGPIDAAIVGGFGARTLRNIWGVGGSLSIALDALSQGSQLRLAGHWSPNSREFVSAVNAANGLREDGAGTYMSASASLLYVVNSMWSASIGGQWAQGPVSGATACRCTVRVVGGVDFTPVTNFTIRGELGWVRPQMNAVGNLQGGLRITSTF